MRAIDADRFELISYEGIPDGYSDSFDDGVCWLAEQIDAAPTISLNAWVHLGNDKWRCPMCGHVVYTEGSWEHPLKLEKFYCEHCGANLGSYGNWSDEDDVY